ncbi:TetR/AcrR family transcriptional regulator [Mycolicibacterium houstonense]|uniref:TetR/AcrR family transcriptional regulator n=1 Tax=Mycolicibacterium houstonense TaxID=146021 RepID=UPI001356FC0B|nr:TetR/AcrR family transcriptional regulator [Mycolicibacterium houstonense]
MAIEITVDMQEDGMPASERVDAAAADEATLADRLLEAAVLEIAESGLDGLSLRSIARKVGVSHQTPTHVFGSRVGLLTALAVCAIRLLRDHISAAAEAARARVADAKDVVIEIGVSYVVFADNNRALLSLLGRPELVDSQDPELVQEREATWVVLTSAIRDAQLQGWRADEPPEVVALMCWSIVHGTALIWRDGLQPSALKDYDVEQLMRSIGSLI